MTPPPVLRHFVETDVFQRTTAGWLTDEEIWEFQAVLAVRPDAGDTIRGSGGFRKIRVTQKGRGKSGSRPDHLLLRWARGDDLPHHGLPEGREGHADEERGQPVEEAPRRNPREGVNRTMATRKHDKPVEVTSENFGTLLIQGAAEAAAIARGKAQPAAVRTVTMRDVAAVPEPPEYSPSDIKDIRQHMGCSQPVFASVLSTSVDTIRSWEQGRRAPDTMGRRLLQVAEETHDVLLPLRRVKHGS